MRTTKPKRNVAGFVDAGGQFHPIRSPEYIGGRKATAKDRRKYSKVLGGDLGIEKQKAALAEKWEDPWDREARLEREERERIEREIDRDVHGSKSERRSLLQFVRDSGGIKRQFRFGGKKAFGKRSEWDKGEIDRLSYKETGKRGLTSERGGKTLDKMYQSAREAGYDVGSIDDMLARVEDEAAGRGTTYATMGALAYNPKKKDLRGPGVVEWNEAVLKLVPMLRKRWPDASDAALLKKAKALATTMNRGGLLKKNPGVTDLAAFANAVFTTMQIHDHMTKKAPKKKRSTAKRRRNPETQAQINARMAKVRAARTVSGKQSAVNKANPAKKPTANRRSLIAPNPRKRVTVPSKGRFYLMTIGSGDDTLGVFINDRDGDGISKKFKTVAAAKAYATKHRLTLENPAKAPRKVNPIFAPAWIKKLIKTGPVKSVVKNPSVSAAMDTLRKKGFYVMSAGAGKFWLHRNGKRSGLIGESTLISRAKKGAAASVKIPFKLFDESTHPKRNPTKATPTAAKRNGTKKAVATKKANPRQIIIEGPTGKGTFFLRDTNRNVWDGKSWRGFGAAKEFSTWNAAYLAYGRLMKKKRVVKKANPKVVKLPTGFKWNRRASAFNGGDYFEILDPQGLIVGWGTTKTSALKTFKKHSGKIRAGRGFSKERAKRIREAAKSLQFTVRNPTPKKAAPKRRTNPVKVPRSRLFENFQGRTTSGVKWPESSPWLGSQRLIQLGKLHEIKLVGDKRPIAVNPNRVILCATQTGKLAIVGQRFAKKNPGMKSNEVSFLGEIQHVVYETYKPHHGDRPKQLYIHELGEVTGQRPKLYADHLGFPIVRGGAYSVRPEGIVN